MCVLHYLRGPLLRLSPDEQSTAFRLLQASFGFVNIAALCAAAVALQNAVPWSLTLMRLPLDEAAAAEPAAAATDASIPTNDEEAKRLGESTSEAGRNSLEAEKRTPQATTMEKEREGEKTETINLRKNEGPDADVATAAAPVAASAVSPMQRSPEAQLFFIGDGEQLQEKQERPNGVSRQRNQTERQNGAASSPSSAFSPASSAAQGGAGATAAAAAGEDATAMRKSPSWGRKALMRVMTGPALILLGPPRKATATKASQQKNSSQ